MKKIDLNLNPSKVQAQLALCATAVAGVAIAPQAHAALVTTFAATVIPIPATTTGIYLNLETGASGTSSAVAGFDFNPYLAGGGTQLGFYWSPTLGTASARGAGVGTTAATGPYLDLPTGTVVGASSIFTSGILATTGSAYISTTGIHNLGFRFTNAAGTTDYGYIRIQTTAGTGFAANILGWVYDNTPGTAVTVNVVPEPSTVAFLAIAGGAAGVRAWRRRKTA